MPEKIKNNWIKYMIFAIFYYLLYSLGLRFAYTNTGVSPIWPSSGLALGVVLIFGREYLVIIAIISFSISFKMNYEQGLLYAWIISFMSAFANTIKIFLADHILDKLRFKRYYFSTTRDGFYFIVTAVLVSFISAMIGIIPIAFELDLYFANYMYIFIAWMIGDLGGILLVTPLLISFFVEFKMDINKKQEALLMYVYIGVLSAFMMIQNYHELMIYIMPYLITLFVLWPIFRFSIRESSIVVLIIFIISLIFTVYEKSIFNLEDLNDSLIALQIFIIFLSSIGIIISGTMAENRRHYNELEILNESLEDKVKERTEALKRINHDLSKEIENRIQTEKELKKIEKILRENENRLKETQKLAHLGSWEYIIDHKIMRCSEETFKILGLDYKESIGFEEYLELVEQDDKKMIVDVILEIIESGETKEIDIRHVRKDGTLNYSHLKAKLVTKDDKPIKIMGSIIDKTIEKLSEEKLKFYATVDEMTGLLNRRTGLLFLEKEFKMAQRGHIDLTICFIDVDGLKETNDKYGHYEGDWMIKKLSESIKESIRGEDFACRLGGDEFLIALVDCNEENSTKITTRIEERIDIINRENDKPYDVKISYGLAEYKKVREKSLDDFIKRADERMYENKIANKQKRGL